jgi:hypothetical protein
LECWDDGTCCELIQVKKTAIIHCFISVMMFYNICISWKWIYNSCLLILRWFCLVVVLPKKPCKLSFALLSFSCQVEQ